VKIRRGGCGGRKMTKQITIKEVSRRVGVSECAVKDNVVNLLVVLPVRERVAVMEYMLYCKRMKNAKKV
jgi:hypothetical protein